MGSSRRLEVRIFLELISDWRSSMHNVIALVLYIPIWNLLNFPSFLTRIDAVCVLSCFLLTWSITWRTKTFYVWIHRSLLQLFACRIELNNSRKNCGHHNYTPQAYQRLKVSWIEFLNLIYHIFLSFHVHRGGGNWAQTLILAIFISQTKSVWLHSCHAVEAVGYNDMFFELCYFIPQEVGLPFGFSVLCAHVGPF